MPSPLAPAQQKALATIVLAGGHARRMGGIDKAQVVLNGSRLIDVLAKNLTLVAPQSPAVAVSPFGLKWAHPVVAETPPFGGPVAGISAGFNFLDNKLHTAANGALIALLAADAPSSPRAIPALLHALLENPDSGAAVIVSASGRVQPLCALWRAKTLGTALSSLGSPRNAAVTALLEHAGNVVQVTSSPEFYERDFDTLEQLSTLGAVDTSRAPTTRLN